MRDSPSHHSSPIFRVTSELSLQVIKYQDDMLSEGDEWVTSGLKWITRVIVWCSLYYSVMGDELQSGVKIQFFFL